MRAHTFANANRNDRRLAVSAWQKAAPFVRYADLHESTRRLPHFVGLLLTLLLTMEGTIPAIAQCDLWLPGSNAPGVSGIVYASTLWDPDGAGPRPAAVVMGGNFMGPAGAASIYLSAWDYTGWSALGSAAPNGPVHAVTVHNGALVIAGTFTQVGGVSAERIARWNGVSWSGLAGGVDGAVYALQVMPNGDLIAAGDFTTAGGVSANRIARWNGSSWAAIGSGIVGSAAALAVLPNGHLVVGGDFSQAGGVSVNNIAAWNGTSWYALGGGVTGGVIHALALDQGVVLVAGGTFTHAGGIASPSIARWFNNAWSSIPASWNGSATVRSLTYIPGGVVVGGEFIISIGGVQHFSVALWNGNNWLGIGRGLAAPQSPSVRTATRLPNGNLFVGGQFESEVVASHERQEHLLNVARYDGSVWSSLASGADGPAYCSAVLADGSIVVGGAFQRIGPVLANSIARWDPAARMWSPLGTGMNSTVAAIAVLPNGDVVAGGNFTTAGGVSANRIARWNGSAWSPIGDGMNDWVLALEVLPNGDLVAGGAFTTASGTPASYVARWNGVVWQPLGSGMNNWVYALCVMPGGDLAAGGFFTNAGGASANRVARWNGATWSGFGTGANDGVYALELAANGDLLCGGSFTMMGGSAIQRIARWNSVTGWSAIGSGMNGVVRSLARQQNGDLLAGGDFTTAGGAQARRIARWNGTAWTEAGPGGMGWSVYTLAICPDGLVVAGGDFITAGTTAATAIAGWRGGRWFAPGFEGPSSGVHALRVTPSGDLLVGGAFRAIEGIESRRGVARLSGSSWSSLGSGIGGAGVFDSAAVVSAMLHLPNGDVVVAGAFATAGGVSANNIARWNGAAWSALGSGLNGPVEALALLPNGDIVAGGSFTTAGGTSALRIARWNGSSWSALGSGFPGAGNRVRALAILPNGDLVAGGTFATAGGAPGNHVARWNGSSWSGLGSGMSGSGPLGVYALAVLPNGELAAGGFFQTAGGVSVNHIARWNGSAWSAYGPGLNSVVRALTIHPNGNLLAGGWFTQSGANVAQGVAYWDGGAWVGSGNGVASVSALAVLPNGRIIVGGEFRMAGEHATAFLAQWSGLSSVMIATQPTDVQACTGAAVQFGVTASGNGPLVYQWLFEGEPIDEQTNPSAISSSLHLPTVTEEQSGMYACVIADACGAVISDPATLSVVPLAVFSQPQDVTAYPGASVTFGVTATGLPPIQYQWRFRSTPIDTVANPSAATALLRIEPVTENEIGEYDCVITTACGTVVSDTAALRFCIAQCPGDLTRVENVPGVVGSISDFCVLPNRDVIALGPVLIGNNPVNGVARYHPATNSWSGLGNTFYLSAGTSLLLPDGDVILGGSFSQAQGAPANRVIRFHPQTNTWTALGSGLERTDGYTCHVSALVQLPCGDLIVGGSFETAGGVPATSIARYSFATGEWSALGSGLINQFDNPGTVRALCVLPRGDILVAGLFVTAGGIPVNGFARYDPADDTWHAPAGGTFYGTVYRMLPLPDGDVLVGGIFSGLGHIARYSPTTGNWTSLGGGVSGAPQTTTVHDIRLLCGGDVLVGGRFTTAGGVASTGLARFHLPTQTWSAVETEITRASGDPIVYAIASLEDGRAVFGGLFQVPGGAMNFGLLRSCIPGDMNCDGVLNNFDIDPFVTALVDPIGYAIVYPDCDRQNADMNGDGSVDNFDIDPFVGLLTGG